MPNIEWCLGRRRDLAKYNKQYENKGLLKKRGKMGTLKGGAFLGPNSALFFRYFLDIILYLNLLCT
jgi:hypothetical protein